MYAVLSEIVESIKSEINATDDKITTRWSLEGEQGIGGAQFHLNWFYRLLNVGHNGSVEKVG